MYVQIDYNVTDPQFKFLRLLSSKATQKFTYDCTNSVGWFSEATGNYDSAVQLMGFDDVILGYSSSETRFEVEDTCSGGKGTGKVEIGFDTRDVDVLPIKDFRAYDFGEKVSINFSYRILIFIIENDLILNHYI